jgi:hypothetical protein
MPKLKIFNAEAQRKARKAGVFPKIAFAQS